jgi:hypothetical protein
VGEQGRERGFAAWPLAGRQRACDVHGVIGPTKLGSAACEIGVAHVGARRRSDARVHLGKLRVKRPELANLVGNLGALVVEQRCETVLGRAAVRAVPDRHHLGHLFERQSHSLPTGDEEESRFGFRVVGAVPGRRPIGHRHEADALVVANCRGRNAGTIRQL